MRNVDAFLGDEKLEKLSKRARLRYRWTLLSASGDLLSSFACVLCLNDLDFSKFWKEDVEEWNFEESVLEIVVLSCLRVGLLVGMLWGSALEDRKKRYAPPAKNREASLVSDPDEFRWSVYDLTYRAFLLSLLLSFCKGLVLVGRGGGRVWGNSHEISLICLCIGALLLLANLFASMATLWTWKRLDKARLEVWKGRDAACALLEASERAERGEETSGGADKEKKDNREKEQYSSNLTFWQIMKVLRPYFWPSSGVDHQGAVFWNRVRCLSTWFFVIGSKACNAIAPLFIGLASASLREALDDAEGRSGHLYDTALWVGLYGAFSFLSKALKECQGLVYLRVKQAAYIEIAQFTFEHLQRLSLQWHLKKKMGNVVRSMDRGTEAADSLMTYLFLYLLPTVGECIAVCIIFFSYFKSPTLASLLFLSLSVYGYLTVKMTLWRRKFRAEANKKDNRFHDLATDALINYETVKYFTNEPFEIARFCAAVRDYQVLGTATQASLSLLNILQQVIVGGTSVASLIICAYAVSNGSLEFSAFVSIQVYIANVFVPLNFLGTIYNVVIKSLIDIRNLSQLLAEEPDVTDKAGAPPLILPMQKMTEETAQEETEAKEEHKGGTGEGMASRRTVETAAPNGNGERETREKGAAGRESGEASLVSIVSSSRSLAGGGGALPLSLSQTEAGIRGVSVEFRDVCFHYPSQPENRGLQSVSFTIPAGTSCALVGPSGSGKTTISRLLFRFYDPTEGKVLINGVDVRSVQQRSVREAIGVVPQDTVMFNDTISHNIEYGRLGSSQADLERVAEQAQIRGFIEALPEKWGTLVGERGLKLSGGEKQRVAIARCLLKDPPVVILDEATSALDSRTEAGIQEALWRLGRDRTSLVIAHRLSTIRHVDQIIVLSQGVVKERGRHEELLKKNGEYAQMWRMQAQEAAKAAHEELLETAGDEGEVSELLLQGTAHVGKAGDSQLNGTRANNNSVMVTQEGGGSAVSSSSSSATGAEGTQQRARRGGP